jgi:hypothetical protein
MRTSTTLLALCFVMTRVHAGEGVFDPDPQHPWNRLDAALTTDERVPEFPATDAKEQFERWLLSGPRYARALAELDAFVEQKSDRLIRDPAKRALLQSKLWAVFDSVSDPTGGHRNERSEIARRACELVQRLALTEAEIAALPDNYRATIDARKFPATHDPSDATRPFLPRDLLPVGRAWLAISDSFGFPPAAAQHSESVQGRSLFYVLIRLPEGISQTRAYARTLAEYPKPYVWQEAYAEFPYARSAVRLAPTLPQFPAGTQVALVRRMMLPDRSGELRVTPIVESIQVRAYVTDPAEDEGRRVQAAFEFRLSPKDLFSDGSGLRVIDGAALETRTPFERQSMFGGPCSNCHGASGIYSVQTYTQSFGRRRPSPWFEAVSTDEYLDVHSLNWKKRQYEWGLLQGMWKVQSESIARP